MITNDTKVVKDQTSDKKVDVKPVEVIDKKDEKAKASEEVKKSEY